MLERDGLLKRTVYPTVPPKVEYSATSIAEELHRSDVTVARRAYDLAAKEAAENQRGEIEIAAPNP